VTFLNWVFVNREGELRSGWRVAAFVACLVVLILLLKALLGVAGVLVPGIRRVIEPPGGSHSSAHDMLASALDSAVNLLAAILATHICANKLEHRSFRSVGFMLHRGWKRLFVIGSLIGAASLTIAVAIETAARSAIFTPQSHSPAQLLFSFFPLFGFFLTAAAFEELAFRGFAFQALVHNIGPAGSIVIMSVFFGLAHLGNPNPTIISTLNTILAGIWLSIAYLATRSLWFATALHYSWNLTMVYLFGLPVSGISTFDSLGLLIGQDLPPIWVSGGTYGPEGGIAATAVLILSTLVIWKSGLFRVSPDLARALKHGTPEPRYLSITAEK